MEINFTVRITMPAGGCIAFPFILKVLPCTNILSHLEIRHKKAVWRQLEWAKDEGATRRAAGDKTERVGGRGGVNVRWER